MANIKWSGIESRKYGLTARWYVSAYYGNDNDVDVVGLYNPSTNPTGHGGPTRPFATIDKAHQQAVKGVTVIDSAYYKSTLTSSLILVGDGNVVIEDINIYTSSYKLYNIKVINGNVSNSSSLLNKIDCIFIYSNINLRGSSESINCIYIECNIQKFNDTDINGNLINNLFIRCTGSMPIRNGLCINNEFIDCSNLILQNESVRPIGNVVDYSIIIGTVKTLNLVNGKTSGVTIEDFKTDGNYFVKSFSEVDLWGNASGSGASVAQLQQLFCNYFSPIYIDTWTEINLHLKTTAPDILKYGGLNGTYIGALPIMHWFTSANLWDNYRDAGNTTDLEKDAVTGAIRISGVAESGTFRSTRINLSKAITANPAKFFANLVYNIEGTVKQGVSNQRIDTTVDLQPDNTANQRVVYDFKMAIAPNSVDALGAFKNYELDREPTVDASGYSHLDDLFDPNTEVKQTIGAIMIEFTLRKVVIA